MPRKNLDPSVSKALRKNDGLKSTDGQSEDIAYLLGQGPFLINGSSITEEDLGPLTRFCRRHALKKEIAAFYQDSIGCQLSQEDLSQMTEELLEPYCRILEEHMRLAFTRSLLQGDAPDWWIASPSDFLYAAEDAFASPDPPPDEEDYLFADESSFNPPAPQPVMEQEVPKETSKEADPSEDFDEYEEEDPYPILLDQDGYRTASGTELTQEEVQEALDLALRYELCRRIRECLREKNCDLSRLSPEALEQLADQLFPAYAYHSRYNLLLPTLAVYDTKYSFLSYRGSPL